MTSDPRVKLGSAKRVIVKVGSRSLSAEGLLDTLCAQIRKARESGVEVVLVSSGAISFGISRLGLDTRPTDIPGLQSAAAIGQADLMSAYGDRFGVPVGQVLLSHADLADRDRYLNARATIDALLAHGAVPIINENDVVTVEELRFGDNDQLAAMVCTLVDADLLVLLTHVDGVLDSQGERVSQVDKPSAIDALVTDTKSTEGSGGMRSKVDAAARATRRGVPTVIANAAEPGVIAKVLAGEDIGTLFVASKRALSSRKHWIANTLHPRGSLTVDDGAAKALGEGSSLLSRGVVGVRGDFRAGDPVKILALDGRELARGLTRYGVEDAARIAGRRSEEVPNTLGRQGDGVLVHRDDLAVS